MCHLPQQSSKGREIANPNLKLIRLCETAAERGGQLATFAAVAKAIGVTPSAVTQKFGHGQESGGTVVAPETLGKIARAFTEDGVYCEVGWFYLELGVFYAEVAKAAPGGSGRRPMTTPGEALPRWERTATPVLGDLVELRLDPPRPANEVPDSYQVGATLLFGTATCDPEPEDGLGEGAVRIALRDATLTVGSESYQPLPGSMIGERVRSDHFRRVAGGVHIVGPLVDGVLEGTPVGDEHLAVIAGTNGGDDPFEVTIAANRRSFVVTDAEAPPDNPLSNAPPDNKNAILNVLIYKNRRKDDAGRAILARATLTRKAAETDPPA